MVKEQFENQAYSSTMKSGVDDVSKPYHYLLMSVLEGQVPRVPLAKAFEDMVMREAIHQVGEDKAKMLLEYCQKMEEDRHPGQVKSLEREENNFG